MRKPAKIVKRVVHGTWGAYSYHGCRCDRCRANASEYQSEQRRERQTTVLPPDDPRHGRYTTYNSYGCRCQRCTTDMVAAQRRYRETGTYREAGPVTS